MLELDASLDEARLNSVRSALNGVALDARDTERGRPRVSERALSSLRALLRTLTFIVPRAAIATSLDAFRLVARRRSCASAERSAARARARAVLGGNVVAAEDDFDTPFMVELNFWCMSSAVAFDALSSARSGIALKRILIFLYIIHVSRCVSYSVLYKK